MNIHELRADIDKIDNEMLALFQARMELSKKVAAYKIAHGSVILDAKRERQIIGKYDEDAYFKRFIQEIMEISRCIQTKIALNNNIVLIGMMGSGKTSVGRILSDLLDIECVDTDKAVEKAQKLSIPSIFSRYGEKGFRSLESAQIASAVAKKPPRVISTGGGVILNEKNMLLLRSNGLVFFLNRPIEAIQYDLENVFSKRKFRLKRPLLAKKNDLIRIYQERLPLYKKYADYEIKGNFRSIDAAQRILKELQLRGKL
ncbi:MAG: chorismate mutase [Clostridiales bacterium]|nr:chorismate mutase [Clostridiales bacterium]